MKKLSLIFLLAATAVGVSCSGDEPVADALNVNGLSYDVSTLLFITSPGSEVATRLDAIIPNRVRLEGDASNSQTVMVATDAYSEESGFTGATYVFQVIIMDEPGEVPSDATFVDYFNPGEEEPTLPYAIFLGYGLNEMGQQDPNTFFTICQSGKINSKIGEENLTVELNGMGYDYFAEVADGEERPTYKVKFSYSGAFTPLEGL